MILDPLLSSADAIVVAWLPGSEGGGVTDILFGDAKPTGKLPHTWPRSMSQIPINQGDGKTDPL
jgi:beta-glucosidase